MRTNTVIQPLGCIIFIVLLLNGLDSFSQEIPVNMYTGTATIEVPVGGISHHDITLPVSLFYTPKGAKLDDWQGFFGRGWVLSAGGSIQRILKGLPDDFRGSGSDPRRGWLRTKASTNTRVAYDVNQLSNTADLNASGGCSDETADYNKINSWNDVIDTEPDVFSYNFPGYSGSFVFDNAQKPAIHFTPYRDISVTYTLNGDSVITSFVIKTNNGFKYTFGLAVSSLRAAEKNGEVTDITFLVRDFKQYDKSTYDDVSYKSEWKLTRIDAPSGAYVVFAYKNAEFPAPPKRPVRLSIYDGSFDYKVITAYYLKEHTEVYRIKDVTGSSGQIIEFDTLSDKVSSITYKDTRRGSGNEFVKEYLLTYDGALLTKVTESSKCDRKPPYTFSYYGISFRNDEPYRQDYSGKDVWGYDNGRLKGNLIPKMYVYPSEAVTDRFRFYPIPGYSGTEIILDGSDRLPNKDYIKNGVLYQMTYPTGGGVMFEYEPNTYYDATASTNQLAGGLRVKSILHYDGMSTSTIIKKQFSYNVPGSSQSSGKLISLPVFILPAWKFRNPLGLNADSLEIEYYSGIAASAQWKLFTIRTVDDISQGENTQGNSVAYQYVTVSRTGAGSARYEFKVPGLFGGTVSGNWTPTENKFARSSACSTMSLISEGGAWRYPFVPNPDIDLERGLIWKISEFNESDTLVRYTENTYQSIFKSGTQPYKVYGVQYDWFANSEDRVYFFGKYNVPTDYDLVLSKEEVTTYDVANSSKHLTGKTEYFYESSAHKFLSRTKVTTADGTKYFTRYKYAADFIGIQSNSEDALLRIKDMQDTANFRHATLIETWAYGVPGDSTKVTGASLVRFSNFGQSGKIFPKYNLTLSLAIPLPIDDFHETNQELQSGEYKLKNDSHYEVVSTVTDYSTSYSLPLSSIGMNRVPVSTLWGYDMSVPVASVSNAARGEFAFSDFETTTDGDFQITNSFLVPPHTGKNGLYPHAILSKSINRGNDSRYVLSFWFKNSSAVSFQFIVKHPSVSTTYIDDTFSVTPDGSGYTYFQKVYDLSSASNPPVSSPFVVTLTAPSLDSPGSGTLTPAIDDVAFYPESATLASMTYNLPFGTDSQTSSMATQYTVHDGLGRESLILDRDKNIIKRTAYAYSRVTPSLVADFSVPEILFTGDTITFYGTDNSCFAGVSNTWTIALAATPQTIIYQDTTTNLIYPFGSADEYIVKHTVSATSMTSQTSQVTIEINSKPISLSLCVSGLLSMNNETEPEVYRSTTCPGSSVPSSGTTFQATPGETDPGMTYVWKKRYVNSENWQTLSSTTSSLSISDPIAVKGSFIILCEVHFPNGRTGSMSFPIDVIGY